MKFINILLLFVNLILTINAQLYINWTPYESCNSNQGSSSGESYGVGYSWKEGKCIYLEGSVFIFKLNKNNKDYVVMEKFTDENCSTLVNTQSYEIGECFTADWYSQINGSYLNFAVLSVGNSIPEISEIEGYRYSLFTDDGCQKSKVFSTYYTNDTLFESGAYEYQFNCDNGISQKATFILNFDCQYTNVSTTCTQAEFGDYYYTITC